MALASVSRRTDQTYINDHARSIVKRAIPLPNPARYHSPRADDSTPVPFEVFYVVQTTADVICKRHRRRCWPLPEPRQHAQIELVRFQTVSAGGGTYSIWKAMPYLEPAEWLYDVVVVDGALIRIRHRNS